MRRDSRSEVCFAGNLTSPHRKNGEQEFELLRDMVASVSGLGSSQCGGSETARFDTEGAETEQGKEREGWCGRQEASVLRLAVYSISVFTMLHTTGIRIRL